jgi:nucleoid DNA-binding protein
MFKNGSADEESGCLRRFDHAYLSPNYPAGLRREPMVTAKRMSKAQVIAELAEKTGLGKKDVQNLFDQLLQIIERELGGNGPGEFVLPDLVKLRVKMTPGRPEHVGVDPFTKQERTFPARPEARKVRVSAAKRLKDGVA